MNRNSLQTGDRKTIEKNRRNNMKQLYSQLYSLVPQEPSSSNSMGSKGLPDQIQAATDYIKNLQADVGKLKETRNELLGFQVEGSSNICNSSNNNFNSKANSNIQKRLQLNSPVQVEVNENGGVLEVLLVTSLECQFIFTEAIRILHEENAEVTYATYSVVHGSVFHTIRAEKGEDAPNYSTARITERLKKFAL